VLFLVFVIDKLHRPHRMTNVSSPGWPCRIASSFIASPQSEHVSLSSSCSMVKPQAMAPSRRAPGESMLMPTGTLFGIANWNPSKGSVALIVGASEPA
jgi:hypothetical protein